MLDKIKRHLGYFIKGFTTIATVVGLIMAIVTMVIFIIFGFAYVLDETFGVPFEGWATILFIVFLVGWFSYFVGSTDEY